jgi:hypothetical protein
MEREDEIMAAGGQLIGRMEIPEQVAVADAAQTFKGQAGQQQQEGDAKGGAPAAVAGCHTFLFEPGAQELHRMPTLSEA